ncbi:DUF1415 domain-containing protein [Bordetella sp. LUAb4]|uniref:DUF1415 domain-containing protein n=1 Tax=Bordetella sp. LUAb4 TaxID=2843195 RepID=UPI001E49F39F|nr:DUF1415 domain-containing protein [Bordetella sp. LUAb4]
MEQGNEEGAVEAIALDARHLAGNHPDIEEVARIAQHWLTRAVIGLNLCPFAKRVHVKRQIRYVVSAATEEADIAAELESELQLLADTDAQEIDTTLLILPDGMADFYEFNDFLDTGDRLLKRMRLRGVLQVASFHPDYQFADTQPDDIENYTNRAPFPILHLLREDSIEEVLETYPDPDDIYEKNQETMRRLGLEGWRKLMREGD